MQPVHQEGMPPHEDAHVRTASAIRGSASTRYGQETTAQSQVVHPVISGPASGHRLYAFTLPDSSRHPVQLWQYLQQSNVILFFYHGVNCLACEAFLQRLVALRDACRQEETAIMAIGSDEPATSSQQAARSGHPFPFLSDPAGQVIAHQGLTLPSLIIADRWGEIWAAWAGGADHLFPSEQDIMQWLSFIEAQCPECTMIEWTEQEE